MALAPPINPSQPPLALPGFEHIQRTWNQSYQAYSARILPGQYYVTKHHEGIYTTLGSCIAACIRDQVLNIGGMNHFLLPAGSGMERNDWKAANTSAATRYGNYAMEHLINEILRNGGKRQNLEVKVFGGGSIMAKSTDVGRRNITFVQDYLQTEGLTVTSEDLGNIYPRMVIYFPATGRVRVKRLRSLHNNMIADQENRYLDSIETQPVGGDVELF